MTHFETIDMIYYDWIDINFGYTINTTFITHYIINYVNIVKNGRNYILLS